MSLTHKSQSALEYMMTYGWAILIIVIVAVILYSMGIFNPSSSITFTSSGFSPFTVSSSLCNNLGYKIAVIAGPIPNNANSLTISKVYLTSATGANATTASYTLTNPVTLKSGQSATILIPNVACNAANVHYSISANIQYSYTVSTLGLQTVNTTGTVAGTSIAGKPSVLTSYEPVTITNSQSSATPSPFQQMVNFTSSDPGWTSISTSNFGQNVEFFYYNGTVIPSWLQNYTSDNATWWLKIAAIPAGSSETVYVGFAPTSTNLFNTLNDGEAPQLSCSNPSDTASCSTYAEYDDGVNVFNNYWNFAGTSLPSGLGYRGTYTIDNSLMIPSGGNFVYSDSTYNAGIIGSYGYFTGSQNSTTTHTTFFGVSSGQFDDSNETMIGEFAGDVSYLQFETRDTPYTQNILSFRSNSIFTPSEWTLYVPPYPESSEIAVVDNTNSLTSTTYIGKYSNNFYIQLFNGGSSSNDFNIYYDYLFIAPYLPNGVMPSISFGNVA